MTSHVRITSSASEASALRQHFLALGEQRIHFGALFFQQSRLRGLDHGESSWASLSRVTVT